MGLRCSVLGHDYGETGVERERDERGAEVVRTAKRVQTCRNCGHERTVSANTEITALEPEAGVVRDGDGRVVAATAEENVAGDDAGAITIEDATLDDTSDTEDGAIDDAADDHGGDALSTNGAGEESAATTDEENDITATDRAATTGVEDEIPTVEAARADETAEPSGRAPGEWPTESDDESIATDAGDGGSASLTPVGESTDGASEDDTVSDPQPLARSWERDGAEPPVEDGTATETNGAAGSVEPGETFACEQCGFTAAVADSPLRAGDSCPECHAGYLARGTRKG